MRAPRVCQPKRMVTPFRGLAFSVPVSVFRLSFWGSVTRGYGKRRESKPRKQRPNRSARLSLVLTQDVHNLGVTGQIVDVKHGYGRNYLLPGKRAVYNTQANRELYSAWEKVEGESIPVNQADFIANYFSQDKEVTIRRNPNSKWAIFEQDISMALLKQHQLHVPLDCVELASPIAQFGEHSVDIRIDESTLISVAVMVEREASTLRRSKGDDASSTT